jgi:plastocyanin
MLRLVLLILCISLALCHFTERSACGDAQPTGQSGTVAGQVRFLGMVPPAKTIMTSDGQLISDIELVVEPQTQGLRYVVAVLVDQREMMFDPPVVAVQHGQAVRFENNDNCNHSVIATSPNTENQFSLFVTASQPYERVFEPQKQPIEIGCSLHAWMKAWVFVVPHPWFAVTDAQGRFKLENVPPGRWKLLLRHPRTGKQERHEIEVRAGATTTLNLDWRNVKN